MEILEGFLDRQDLVPIIEKSLARYESFLVEHNGALILNSSRLGERSSIAHSAFMLLASCPLPTAASPAANRRYCGRNPSQQGPDGSYNIYFEIDSNREEQLYAGEAILALMHAYKEYPDVRYLPSVERAMARYDEQYFQRAFVPREALIFFSNWQTQTCRLLFECAHNNSVKEHAADYVFRVNDRILADGFFENVKSRPEAQHSVEVACTLESLNDTYAACAWNEHRAQGYAESICIGLDYLLQVQSTDKLAKQGRGGFGFSLDDRSQRVDVIGHASNAFVKTLQNGIAFP